VLDVREEFARDCVLPALQGARPQSAVYPEVVALAWPLIAKKLVEVAAIEGAAAIAHGSTATAIDDAARALQPDVRVIAPAREWGMTADQLLEWARVRGVPVPLAKERAYTVRENLWGRSVTWTAGADADAAPADLRRLETVRSTALGDEAFVEISFDGETPVAVNGVPMPLTELIESVSVIAAQQGVGRIERSETDPGGAVTRMLYEAPAAMVLQTAYAHREEVTGKVRVKLSGGQQTVVRELVNQA
jgi:argininosuccinate synthase